MSKQNQSGHHALVGDFLKHYEEHHVLREGKALTYAHMHGFGMLRPFAVRLPVTMIAEFDALANYGPWQSKQEMLYHLIRASMDEIAAKEPSVREQMTRAADEGLQKWKKSQNVSPVLAKAISKAKR